MLVRVGRTLDVASGGMVAFDVDGTPVTVAKVDGRLLRAHRAYRVRVAGGELQVEA